MSKLPIPKKLRIYFSDYFDVAPKMLAKYGAFNVSLINDLPLFIDPFLLFNSKKPEYRGLHEQIISYMRFLRDRSAAGPLSDGLLKAWFMFPEVKQTWLGFSRVGNAGAGLGIDFARTLHRNLTTHFSDFGEEKISKGSHLEKLCLIDDGVGRDNISDFTTNLIKDYLLRYTQVFAQTHLKPEQRRAVTVPKVSFNYDTQTWQPGTFELPFIDNDYVVLTPRNLLTLDDTWINRHDLLTEYDGIVQSVPDDQLRAQLNNYFASLLPRLPRGKEPSSKDLQAATVGVLHHFPQLLNYYIKYKEERGDRAVALSRERVNESESTFIQGVARFVKELERDTGFYRTAGKTLKEARERVQFLKDVIENKGGHRLFFDKSGKPIRREQDVHILFRLTWYASESDVSREVNDGRGPVDFKISRGARDKSLVEFKLASNSKLMANLQRQAEIYQ
jgi:hypothetical protein